jgi:hypothetical protein
MTRLNRLAPRTPTATAARRARGDAHRPAREARTRRSYDGVVASYIRELTSTDTAPSTPPAARHA